MRQFANMNTLYIVAAIIAVSAFVLPRGIESLNLHANGISHFSQQIEEYLKVTEPVDGEFKIVLDLNNPESNQGKILFDDGESQISILEIVPWEEAGYEVIFRSHGTKLPGGAALVSGVDHIHTETGLSQTLLAEARAGVAGQESYELTPSGSRGLIHHDGDQFGFYLDAPAEDEIEVTITNLQLNLWMKIP